MLQAIEEPTILDRVITIKPTPRVERLREAFLNRTPTASIDWARIVTKAMRGTEEAPMVTRRAQTFAAVVREMPIDIYPDELLVGRSGVRPHCANITPANAPTPEALRSRKGKGDPVLGLTGQAGLSDEETRELAEELAPYWREQGRMQRMLWHYGHNIHNYEKALKKGFLGIKEEAEERLARLDLTEPDELKKVPFLEGVILAMEAAAEIGKRFSTRARELAEEEEDTGRKTDLLRIAEVCDRVPAKPARTFHEALQGCFFIRLMVIWELAHDGGFCLGRMDQYLYPYYESDIREGRISKEEAQELLDCYIIKVGNAGASASMAVGGVKADGNDATNELSYMFTEAIMHTRLAGPSFAVLIHSKTPDDFLIKACQLCSLGAGHPQFLNSDVFVAQALARGSMGGPPMTLEDARSASNVGCLELVIPGKDSGYLYFANYSNHALAMDLVMTNGVRRSDGKEVALQTGDPRQFKSFEEVQAAFREQLAWMRRNVQIHGSAMEQKIIDLYPTVCESALIDDCIEKGICREEGGAHYNFNVGITQLGSPDVGDSLAAIKKLVFEDRKITMAELCDALDADFEGYEDIRKMCLEAPKFGNDDDYVDEQVAWVLHQWVSEFTKMKNLRGGYGCPGGSSTVGYVVGGRVVGALPSGRLSGEPLADATSPSPGNDRKGPTAILKSMGKVDGVEILGGTPLNMRIDPAVFKDGDGFKRLSDLMRAFIDQKICHVQINVVSSDTLRSAQEDPVEHRDLVVKVAGYNAFFTQLTRDLQDSIIARTEHMV